MLKLYRYYTYNGINVAIKLYKVNHLYNLKKVVNKKRIIMNAIIEDEHDLTKREKPVLSVHKSREEAEKA